MPIETFDVTDENGARVIGTAEAYRDPKGAFYDPSSPYYQHPRFSDHDIRFMDDKDLCRIDRAVLGKAMQEAFRNALIKLGIPDPSNSAVGSQVNKSIADALRACAPMSQVEPPSGPRLPSMPIADTIIDNVRRQQQLNAGRPQSPVLDTGEAFLPSVPAAALAPRGYGGLADDPSRGKLAIRRLTRVQG